MAAGKGLSISLKDSTLMVLPQMANRYSPDYLSRGAQEQAYLALRLAYIKEHSRHAQSCQTIMDGKSAVNFDPERVKRAAKDILPDWLTARTQQQLFYFTCQPHVAGNTCGSFARRCLFQGGKTGKITAA